MFRNPISHFVEFVCFLLNASEIIMMQAKNNVCGKNDYYY